jgi:hypothetical protein
MTKAENRAAAKASPGTDAEAPRGSARYCRRCRSRGASTPPDYLIFEKEAGVPHHDLTKAIGDYVERLTGDRRVLHAPNHSIG